MADLIENNLPEQDNQRVLCKVLSLERLWSIRPVGRWAWRRASRSSIPISIPSLERSTFYEASPCQLEEGNLENLILKQNHFIIWTLVWVDKKGMPNYLIATIGFLIELFVVYKKLKIGIYMYFFIITESKLFEKIN